MTNELNVTVPQPLLAPACLTAIANAYAASQHLPAPAAVRTGYVTLFCAQIGVAVEARFRRITPSRFPEVRVGVVFRADKGDINAAMAQAFERQFASELRHLGHEPWPSPTNFDRRFTTPIPVPRPGEDIDAFARHVADVAVKYSALAQFIQMTAHSKGRSCPAT